MKELVLRERAIRTDDLGRICLNDIWASGPFKETQRAYEWWRYSGARKLAEALLERLGKPRPFTKADIREVYSASGKPGGGTYAHPVLACAYAGYLSPGLDVEVRE